MKIKEVLENIKHTIIKRNTLKETGRDIRYLAVDLATLFMTLAAYLVAAVTLGLIVFKIIAVGGIEAILADLMATTCINNPGVPCDFNTLLGGIGLSLVVVTGAAIAIMRETLKIEEVPFIGPEETHLTYNDKQADLLEFIRKEGGVENLHAVAIYKGIAYTTLRNYVEKFEKDGYVTIHRDGKGKAVEVVLVR